MEKETDDKNIEEAQQKEEDEKIIKCFICQMEIDRLEYYRNHYDECRRKNTIRALSVRRNRTYIKDGKKYSISDIEHVFRRGNRRTGEVNAIIVKLYCDEDQTSIRTAFRWDKRFIVDKDNYIIIN